MKKKGSIITTLSIFVIVIALFVTVFLEDAMGDRVIEIITVITAIIGALALFLQFKKDKELNQASFVLEYSKSFFGEYNLGDFFCRIDDDYDNSESKYKFDIDKEREDYMKYMLWIESLSAVVLDNVLDIESIDKALGYRFFLIVNNKDVQKQDLIPWLHLYEGTCILYYMWYKYRKKNGIFIPNEKNSLHLVKGFDEIVKKHNL